MNGNLFHKGTLPLETQRLILRGLTQNDAQKVFDNWTCDDEVSKYLRWNTHKSVEVTSGWLKECENQALEKSFYDWGIILKDTNEPIGSIGVFTSKDVPGRYEVGYVIGKRYWNKGYVTEALRCVINFMADEVGVKRFMAVHADENPASGAVLRHIGFSYVSDGSYTSFDGLRTFHCRVYYLDI